MAQKVGADHSLDMTEMPYLRSQVLWGEGPVIGVQ
jgi:hypothetical protein